MINTADLTAFFSRKRGRTRLEWSDWLAYLYLLLGVLIVLLPIFWMFLGIGKENYGALAKLDELTGRIVNNVDVDNTGFEEIDDLFNKPDEWLYNKVMMHFAKWVKLAIMAKILDKDGMVLAA